MRKRKRDGERVRDTHRIINDRTRAKMEGDTIERMRHRRR